MFSSIALHPSVDGFHSTRSHGNRHIYKTRSAAVGFKPGRPHGHRQVVLGVDAHPSHRPPRLAKSGHFLQCQSAKARGCIGRALCGKAHHPSRCHHRRQGENVGALASKATQGGGLVAHTGLHHRGIKPSNRLFNSNLRCASCSPSACRLIFDFFALGKISSCSSLTWWRMYSLNTLILAS